MSEATPDMRVAYDWRERRWIVWEDYGIGKKSVIHSKYMTGKAARAAARAQAAQDRKDAETQARRAKP